MSSSSLVEFTSFIEVHFVEGEGSRTFNARGRIFRIFLGRGEETSQKSSLAISCPYMGFSAVGSSGASFST